MSTSKSDTRPRSARETAVHVPEPKDGWSHGIPGWNKPPSEMERDKFDRIVQDNPEILRVYCNMVGAIKQLVVYTHGVAQAEALQLVLNAIKETQDEQK